MKNGTGLLLFYKLSPEPAKSEQYCCCLYLTRVRLKYKTTCTLQSKRMCNCVRCLVSMLGWHALCKPILDCDYNGSVYFYCLLQDWNYYDLFSRNKWPGLLCPINVWRTRSSAVRTLNITFFFIANETRNCGWRALCFHPPLNCFMLWGETSVTYKLIILKYSNFFSLHNLI